MAPELVPKKFQERPFGASKMQENSVHHTPLAGGGVRGREIYPRTPPPLSTLWVSGFGPSDLAPDPK